MTINEPENDVVETAAEEAPYHATIGAVAFACLCLGVAVGASVLALGFPGRAGLAPLTVGIPTVILMMVVVIHEIRHLRRGRVRNPLVANPYLWVALYAVTFYVLGALAALAILSFTLIRFRGGQSWKATLIATAAAALAFFVMTETVLGESLYRGVFLEQLR
ncbi:hypothetical protein F7P69_11385 [Cellulosimicrobium funkei]|nr:hypothetical protein [Cellulosimicrobium funkei]